MAKYSPETLSAMSAQITDNAKKWWALARATFGDGIGTMPELKMNARLTSTAGRAFIMNDPAYCDFSVYLFEKYPEEFFNDTVPHELAHHIAWRLHGDKGHGKAWKNIAERLYGDSGRCHQMVTANMAKKGVVAIEKDGTRVYQKAKNGNANK